MEPGYEFVRVWEGEKEVEQAETGIKHLVLKKQDAATVIGELVIGDDREHFVHVGDINEHRLQILRIQASKAKRPPIQDIILLKVSDPSAIEVPIGYDLMVTE